MTDMFNARHQWFTETILGDGGHCPCCDRWGKQYRRGINTTMANGMVWLAQHTVPGGEWVDVPKTAGRDVLATNQFTTMRWWKMCERHIDVEDTERKHSGLWRITDLGARWVRGEVAVPRYVWTYNNEVKAIEGPDVYIGDIVEGFSYPEVMSVAYSAHPDA